MKSNMTDNQECFRQLNVCLCIGVKELIQVD